MLEWLKTILGDGYTEEIDKKVSAEIGKAFVSKADFNLANDEVKDWKKTAGEYKKNYDDLAVAQGDAVQLQKDLETERTARAAEQKAFKLERLLSSNGCTDSDYLIFKLGDTVEFTETGDLKDSDTLISKIKESYPAQFPKKEETAKLKGMAPAEGGETPPAGKATADMSYSELCTFLESNPDTKL